MGTLAFPLPWGGNGDGGSSATVFQRALWANRAQYQTLGNVVTFTDFGGGTAQNGGGTDLKFSGASILPYPVPVALTAGTFDANDVRISLWVSLNGAAETCTLQGYRALIESTDSL